MNDINGNVFYTSSTGLQIEGPEEPANHQITGNIFKCDLGIKLINTRVNNIIGNIFYQSGNHIIAEKSTYNIISSNLMYYSDTTGIFLKGSSYNIIHGNYLINVGVNQNGVFWGIALYSLNSDYSTHNVVEHNVIRSFADNKPRFGIGEENSSNDYNIIKNNIISDVTELAVKKEGSNTVVKENIGHPTENSGTATFDGDGTTTDFSIGAHGLAITDPSKIVVKVTPISSDAIAASPCVGYVDPADNTKIRVKFASAPASGTGNVKIVWEAQVVS